MTTHTGFIALLSAVTVASVLQSPAFAGEGHAGSPAEAKKIFNSRCTACHSFGRGVKVGPDLKGVTARRPRPWLFKFIRSSSETIKSGDPTARELFAQFKQQRMPDWTDLSEKQIASILDWLAANGPEQKEPDERNAEVAVAGELQMGKALFHGEKRLANGGLACRGCHTIGGEGTPRGGSLGPDLTSTYLKFQDRALTLFLKHPCFPRAPQRAEYLTPWESFAIKAYMRQAAVSRPARAPSVAETTAPRADKRGSL